MLVEEMRRVPFKKAALGWLQLRAGRNELSAKQIHEYARNINTLDRFFGGKKIAAITEEEVKNFQFKRSQEVFRTHKDGTVQLVGRNSINKEGNLLCQLRAYVGPAFPKGSYKPIRKKRGEKKKVGRALNDEERAHLLYVAQTGPRSWWGAYLFAKIALNTSARPGEVRGIQLSDINLPERVVHIRGTKTDQSDRWEPLNEEAFDAVVEGIERLKSLVKHLGPLQPEWFLFPYRDPKTRKYDPTKSIGDFRMAWEQLRDAAGMPWLRQNDLRHTVASAMAHDPLTTQETTRMIMGHDTAKMTEHYQHLEMQKKREAFDRLLRKKKRKYEKKPAQSVATDPELAQQMAGMFKGFLQSMFAEMQKPK